MPTLQDGMKLPKWKPRAQRGQFVGWSPMHASSVGLIRNLVSGQLSPQCHIVFDPWFETVSENGETAPEAWDLMMSHHCHEVELDEAEKLSHQLVDDWLSEEELAERKAVEARKRTHLVPHDPPMAKQVGEEGAIQMDAL